MKNIYLIVPCGRSLLIAFFLLISLNPLYAQLATKRASVNNQDVFQRTIAIGQDLFGHQRQVQSSKTDLTTGWVIDTRFTQSWVNSTWINEEFMTNKYDSKGNHTGSIAKIWDTATSTWKNSIDEAWTYNSSGIETMYSDTDWTGSSLGIYRSIPTYNEKGYEINSLEQFFINNAWVNTGQNTITYDAKGNATSILSQTWTAGTWVNSTYYTGTYDLVGNRTSLVIQNWYNSAWTNYGQGIYTYDGNGNQTNALKQEWSASGWVNYLNDSFTFDAHGYPATKLEQSWSGNTWVNSIQNIYTCDAYGNTINDLETNWHLGAWENFLWTQYNWKQVTTLNIQNPIEGNTILEQNYPNPFKATTTFKYRVKEPGYVSLKVFDVLGNQLASLVNEQKSAGDYSIGWNAEEYKSGLYFCKLQNGNCIEVRKMLLQK